MLTRITTRIILDADRAEKERYICQEITMDSADRVLDETEYASDGAMLRKLLYRYAPSGEVSTQIEFDSFNHLIERQDFIEDEGGQIQRVVTEYADGTKLIKSYDTHALDFSDTAYLTNEHGEMMGKEILIFDERQQPVQEIAIDANGVESWKMEKEFDDFGNILSEFEYRDGNLVESTHYTYNLKGLLAEKVRKHGDGAIFASEDTVYNDDDLEVRKSSRSMETGTEVIEEWHYDGNKNIVLNTIVRNGKLVFRNSCAYDDGGRLVLEDIAELDGAGGVARHEKLIHEYVAD